MRRKHIILRNLAKTGIVFLFTCLLVFSMMPQKSLHNIFAKHTDVETCSIHKNFPIDQVESIQKHCQVDHLVVALPFLKTSSYYLSFQAVYFSKKLACPAQKFSIHFLEIIDSRGPPNYV